MLNRKNTYGDGGKVVELKLISEEMTLILSLHWQWEKWNWLQYVTFSVLVENLGTMLSDSLVAKLAHEGKLLKMSQERVVKGRSQRSFSKMTWFLSFKIAS